MNFHKNNEISCYEKLYNHMNTWIAGKNWSLPAKKEIP